MNRNTNSKRSLLSVLLVLAVLVGTLFTFCTALADTTPSKMYFKVLEDTFTYTGKAHYASFEVRNEVSKELVTAKYQYSTDDGLTWGTDPIAFTKPVDSATIKVKATADGYETAYCDIAVTVEKATLVVSVTAKDRSYDGTGDVALNIEIESGRILGDEVKVTGAGKINGSDWDASTIPYFVDIDGELKPTGKDAENYVVAEYYKFITVKVNKRAVVLTSASDTWVYNGQEHSNSALTVGGEKFVQDDTYTADFDGSTITDAGTIQNKFTVTMTAPAKESNYTITRVYGTLTVEKLGLVVKVDPDYGYKAEGDVFEKVYDGTAEVALKGNVEIVSGPLPEDTSKVTATLVSGTKGKIDGSDKNIGENKQFIVDATAIVLSGEKAGNYKVDTITHSKLNVVAKEITFTATPKEASRKYDGSKNATVIVAVDPASAVEGDEVYIDSSKREATGTLESADASDTPVNGTVTVTGDMLYGKDKGNYVISETKPTFSMTITKRQITLISSDDDKLYDGTALTKTDGFTSGGDMLVPGEEPVYTATGSQTIVGESKNTFSYNLDSDTCKACNYTVTGTTEGTLKVTARSITVTANTAAFDYDGTAHTDGGYEMTGDGEAPGQATIVTVSGSITDYSADGVENKVESVTVYDGGGNNVTSNYKITPVSGKLTINRKVITPTLVTSTSQVYDGTTKVGIDFSESGLGDIIPADEGSVEFDQEKTTATIADKKVGTDKPVTVSIVLKGDKAANYTVTNPENKTVNITKRPVGIDLIPKAKDYDGKKTIQYEVAFSTGETGEGKIEGDSLEIDKSNAVVELQDVDVDTEKSLNISGFALSGTDASNYELKAQPSGVTATVNKATVTLTSSKGTKAYDGTAFSVKTVTPTGFAEGEGATYSDYASITDVGEVDNTFEYELNDNTKAGNYTIEKKYGKLTVTQRVLTVDITAYNRTYNGDTEVKVTVGAITGILDADKNNVDIITDNVKGFMLTKDAGIEKPVTLSGVNLTGTRAFNYKLADVVCTVDISPKLAQITATAKGKVYDGTKLIAYNAAYDEDDIIAGDIVNIDTSAAVATVENADASSSSKIVTFSGFTFGGKDGGNYSPIQPENTKVLITSRPIHLKSNSASKIYDGTSLSDNKVFLLDETSFVEGDVIEIKAVTKLTNAGMVKNEIEIVKSDSYKDSNYIITENLGTLTVERRSVTLTSGTSTKIYDGKPLTCDRVTVSGQGFVDGEGVNTHCSGEITKVGSARNIFSYTFKDGTLAANYNITSVNGVLTVLPKGISLSVEGVDYKGAYDGKYHGTAANCTVIGAKLVYSYKNASGKTVTTTKAPTIKDVGYLKVTVTASVEGLADATDTYVLKVTPREVTITAKSYTKYVGESDPKFKATVKNAISGEYPKYSLKRVSGEAAGTYKIKVVAEEYQGNYHVTTVNGKLIITKLPTITLSKSKLTMYKGNKYTLKATVKNLEDYKLVWKTNNPSVVTVSNGKLVAVGKGSCIISCGIKGTSIKAKCTVTVK